MRSTLVVPLLLLSACIRNPKDLPGAQEGGFISGVVVEQDLTTGDLGGVSGALISEISTNARVTADADGRFNLDRLPIGRNLFIDVRRTATPPTATKRLAPMKLLVDGQTRDLGEIRLGENGGIEGRVLLEQTNGAPAAAGGTAVVVAATAFKGLTSEDGRFLIPSVPQGTFEVVVFRPGYRPARASGVEVPAAVTVRVRDLVMTPGDPPQLKVTGEARLSDADAGGHAGIEARFVSELDPTVELGPAITDGDGRYELQVPVGVYRVRISHAGYAPVELVGVAVLEEGVIGLIPVTLSDQASRPFPEDDRDGDGCKNDVDAFPDDPFGCFDTDGDGIADEIDIDDDDDTLSDYEELSIGQDGFVTDPLSPDTDGDGVRDPTDNCPTVENADQAPDACAELIANPVLVSFTPTMGRIGAPVTITGLNFVPAGLTAVQFGNGTVASAGTASVTPSSVVVAVPVGAQSGPLRLYTGGRIAISEQSFEVIPPPRIVRVVPPAARENGAFAVVGFDVAGGELFIGGVATIARACSAAEDAMAPADQEVACARVAPGTPTGRLEVRTAIGGPSFENVTLVVLIGPVIYEVRPNPAAQGIPVTIVGDGFGTSDTSGAVMVEFAGAAPVAPTRIREHAIEAVVPANAISGTVRVIHPAGDAVSSRVLTLDDGLPIIYDFDHTLVEAGDTLMILGRNLNGVTSVAFTGGVGTANSSTDGQITTTVPAGVDPGPVTVTVAAGMASSPIELAVLEVSAAVYSGGNLAPGLGISPDDATLYGLTAVTTPELITIDAATLTEQSRITPMGPTQFPTLFALAPDGVTALIFQNGSIFTVESAGGSLVGTCARAPQSNIFFHFHPPAFDDQSRYAFTREPTDAPAGEEGVLRVDLSNGSCDYFMTSPAMGTLGILGMVYDPISNALIVNHPERGLARVDLDSAALITGFTPPGIGGSQLFRGINGTRLYATGQNSPGLTGIEPFQTATPDLLAIPTGLGVQTKNGRWLMVGTQGGTAYVFDLLDERVARSNILSVSLENAAAGVSEFYVDTEIVGQSEDIRRFTIRD